MGMNNVALLLVCLSLFLMPANSVSRKENRSVEEPTTAPVNNVKTSTNSKDKSRQDVTTGAVTPSHTPSAVNSTNTATNATHINKNQTAANKSSGKDEKIDGMSESLADYLLDMLMSHSNKTGTTLPPSANATTQNVSTTTVSARSNMVTSPAQHGKGHTTSNAKEANNAINKTATKNWGKDQWSGRENYGSSSTTQPVTNSVQEDCHAPVDLRNYCLIDKDVIAYFGGDTTTTGLRSPVFNMGLVHQLMSCPRGSWCLPNKLEMLREMQTKFVKGPLCQESMWKCIFDIMVQREKCPDKEFMFVVDSVDMLCELFKTRKDAESKNKCFAHALSALHVTYADFLANNMSSTPPSAGFQPPEAICEGYSYRMIKTYLCADSNCGDSFDARLAMEKFGRWAWFMSKVDKTVSKCDVDDTCGTLKEPTYSTSTKTWFGMTTSSYFWSGSTTYAPITHHGVTGGIEDNDRLSEEDESLMVALSVATAVGLLFMVLGLVFWKKNRRRNLYYYRTATDGYDKVPSDEAHLLSRSND